MRRYVLVWLLIICFLTGCSVTEKNAEDSIESKPSYFFPSGTVSQTYKGKVLDLAVQEEEFDISVTEVKRFEEGSLYQLELNCNEEIQDEYGVDRKHLGFFMVLDDRIYLINDEDEFKTVGEIVNAGTLVCSEEGKKDTLDENACGWHEYILVDGNRREYHGYNDLTETGYYECFVWELGKGLVEYRSGYGAEADAIQLFLPEQ